MAFPTVSETGYDGASSTSHTISLPSWSAGDLIIIAVNARMISVPALTWTMDGSTTKWSTLWSTVSYSNGHRGEGKYRVMQAGDASSVVVSLSTAKTLCATILLIPAASWHGTTAPEANVAATSGSSPTSTFDTPAVTPSWGAADTLWLTVAAVYNRTINSIPTNYTGFSLRNSIYAAKRTLNASSEDPGNWGASSTTYWSVGLVAVRPAVGTNLMPYRGGGYYPA